jgi:Ni2+-binding GTPase involved in maturation of urease and hydrogenase
MTTVPVSGGHLGPDRIPMVVLGGWLGSGKTTLLNRLLRASGGERIAVVVNDIGVVNLDAELVAAREGDTVELTNGCVCCSIGDSLALTLRDLVLSDRPPDRLVIEASGVAEPDRVAAYGDRRRIRLDGVVVAVDATDVVARASDATYGPLVRRQAEAAELLVLTKTDVAADGGAAARAWCAEVAPGTPVVEARDDDTWVPLVLGGLDSTEPTPAGALDVPVVATAWRAVGPVDVDLLAALLADNAHLLLRAKAVVADVQGGYFAVHLAGGRVTAQTVTGPASGRLVVIAAPGSCDSAGLVETFEAIGFGAIASGRDPMRWEPVDVHVHPMA